MKAFALAAAVAALSLGGCATTSGTDASVSRSGFHQAAAVNIGAHATAQAAGLSSPMIGIGAQWQQQNPTAALLAVEMYAEIIGITGAALNIDGEIVTLQPLPGLTDFSKASGIQVSRRMFSTDMATIKRVTTAKRVWVKVGTTKGWVEDAIIDGSKDSKAFHALGRFLTAVEKEQAQK